MIKFNTFKNSLALSLTALELSPPFGTYLYAFFIPAAFAAFTYSVMGLPSISPKFLSLIKAFV